MAQTLKGAPPKFVAIVRHRLYLLLFLSVIYALFISCVSNMDLMNDSGQYFVYAHNLLNTSVYGLIPGVSDGHREPGYVIFLAIIFKFINDSFFTIAFVQAFLLFWSVFVFSITVLKNTTYKWHYFFLCIFSPTMAGTSTAIYSEILFIILLNLFLSVFYVSIQKSKITYIIIATLLFSALVLTKSYFYYFAFLILLLSVFYYFKNKHPIAKLLFAISLAGIVSQQVWQTRTKMLMGSEYSNFRVPNAIVGRVERVYRFNLPQEIGVSLASSIGSNFCYKVYSEKACFNYEIRGADYYGSEIIQSYYKQYPKKIAEEKVILEYLPRYLERPMMQIYASFLETIRMLFFEAPQKSKIHVFLNQLGAAWHFGGSIIILFFAMGGLKQKNNFFDKFMILILFFHWLFMAQFTNLVRYGFTVLPVIYYFAAKGAPPKFVAIVRYISRLKLLIKSKKVKV